MVLTFNHFSEGARVAAAAPVAVVGGGLNVGPRIFRPDLVPDRDDLARVRICTLVHYHDLLVIGSH